MRATHLGALLLGLGLVVGILAGLGLLLGFQPARLPPALLNIAAYKLTFLAAFGLLAAGAVVQRFGRRHGGRPTARLRADEPLPQTARHASGDPLAERRHAEHSSTPPTNSKRHG